MDAMGSSVAVDEGAGVHAPSGIYLSTSGTLSTVTVNGTLEAAAPGDYSTAVYAGKVRIGSSGRVFVIGSNGVKVTCENSGHIYTATDTFTISPMDIRGAAVTLGERLTYNEEAQTQTVSSVMKDGIDLLPFCSVTGNTGTDAGDYSLTVTALDADNYTILTGTVLLYPYTPSEPSGPAAYSIRVQDPENKGIVRASRQSAVSGTLVTITAEPAPDFWLTGVTVLDSSGKPVTLKAENSVYTFRMPNDYVTVKASFVPAFKDVDPDDSCYEPLIWAIQKGIATGTAPGYFSPNEFSTRSQVVTFLWRAAGSPEPTAVSSKFRDIKPDDSAYKAVLWAEENGITSGTSADRFSPNASCTRAQVITFLWRMQHSPASEVPHPFLDVKENDYFQKPVQWASEHGITIGTGMSRFSPMQRCTRAQIIIFLWHIFNP